MKSRDAMLVLVLVMLVCSINFGSALVASAETTVTPEGPYIDTLLFKVLSGIDEEVPALLNDEIDLIGEMVDSQYLDMLSADPDVAIDAVPRNGYGYFLINCDRYPLNETALRRAWAFALDKELISTEVWDGYSTPQDSVLPLVNPFTIEDQLTYHYYTANPTEGNRILDDAGFLDIDGDGYREAPDGSDFSITINTAQISPISTGCGDIGKDAFLSLGIDVNHEPIEFQNYLSRVQNGRDYDIVFLGCNYDDLTVDWLAFEFWSEMAYDPNNNYPNFRNATFDSWREQLLHSPDYSAVYEAAIEMQRILVYQCPIVVAYNNLQFSAYRTDRFEGQVLDSVYGSHGWWTNQKVHLKDSEGGPIGGIFRKSIPWGLSSYNVLTVTAYQDTVIHDMLYDSLLKQDQNGDLIPWLAESYTAETYYDNPNIPLGHTRFTFSISQSASWSDGMPLTAQDIAFTFNYLIENEHYFSQEFRDDVFAAYAPTDYTFVIEFSTESYWHLSSIAQIPILPKHQWLYEDPYTFNPSWDELVTSGPFILTDDVPGELIEMSYNPTYFKLPDRDGGEPIPPSSVPSTPTEPQETDSVVKQWQDYLQNEQMQESRIDPLLESYIESGDIASDIVTSSSGALGTIAYIKDASDVDSLREIADVKWVMDLNLVKVVHVSVDSQETMQQISELDSLCYLSADKVMTTPKEDGSIETTVSLNMNEIGSVIGATGDYGSSYTGSGVVVGVDDSGTDFSHPDLQGAMAVDAEGYPLSYDPTGWGLQPMVLANASYVADTEAWIADGNVLTYEVDGKYYLNVSTWDPVCNNQGGTRNLLGLLPPYGDGYPFGNTVGFIGLYEYYWGINSASEFVSTEMWKDWEIPAPTGSDYRVGWIYEGRWDRYAKLFAPTIILDNTNVIIDWNSSIAWTKMWNWAINDQILDLTNPDDRNSISSLMDWSFTDDIAEGYVYTVNGNNVLAADVNDDGSIDWGLGSFTWMYDDAGFFPDERLFCGMRSDGMALGLMYPSDNSHGQWTASAIASRGVLEHDIYRDGSSYTLPGVANESTLIAVKGVTAGSDLGAAFWAAGFHLNEGTGYWEYTGEHKADIVSNSWTYDSGSYLDLTYRTMTWDLISVPGFVDPANPGTLFMVASGNAGAGYMTSAPPATSAAVVSVGATTSVHKENEGLGTLSMMSQMEGFSSNGPSFVGLVKPDIVAPGCGVTPSSFQNILLGDESFYWWSGTSLSCPIAAGAAAVILEALKENGLPYDPVTLKEVLLSSAKDLGYDAFTQGHGLVDIDSAIQAITTSASDFYYFHNTDSYDNYADAMQDAWSEWMFYDTYGVHQESVIPPTSLGMSSLYFGNVYPGGTSSIDLTAYGYDGLTHGLSSFDTAQPWRFDGLGPYTMSFGSYVYDINGNQFPGFHNLTEIFTPIYIENLLNAQYATLSIRYDGDPAGITAEIWDWTDTDGNGLLNPQLDGVNFGDTLTFIAEDNNDCTCLWMRLANLDTIRTLFDGTPTLIINDPAAYEGGSHWVALEVSYWSPVNDPTIVVSDGGSNIIYVTLSVPQDAEPGIHQGFIEFGDSSSGFSHQVPYSYMVAFNMTADESEIQTIIDRYGTSMEPYDNGAIESSHEYSSNLAGDWGGLRTFLINVPSEIAGVLVFRIEWDTADTVMDLYLRSTTSVLLAKTNDGYLYDTDESTPLYAPTPTELTKNTLIYNPGDLVQGEYYLSVASYCTGNNKIPEDFTLTVQWFTSIPDPVLDVSYTSLWNPTPSPITDHQVIDGDHIIVNASWSLPGVSNFPEMEINHAEIRFASGVYYVGTQELVDPDDWYDPFNGYLDLNQYSIQYVDGIHAGDEVRITVDFSVSDCDIFVYWADTDPAYWTYATNLLGDDLVTVDVPETAVFYPDRDGTLAFVCYDYAQAPGTWTLTVDSLVYDAISSTNSWVAYDTSSFGYNVMRDLYLTGTNAAGGVFEAFIDDVTFNNFFAPTVDILSPDGGESWTGIHDITWSSTSPVIDFDFSHDVYISNDYGISWQLYARNLNVESFEWDTTIWQVMSSYLVKVVTNDRGMIGYGISEGTFTAGELPLPDSTPPIVEGDDSIEYMQLDTGSITWSIFDLHPYALELWIDDVLDTTYGWTEISRDLTVDCYESIPGTYNYTLSAIDMAGNRMSYTTYVYVTPDPAPVIISHGDLSYIEGQTGRYIHWEVEDTNLATYELQLDGITIESGPSTSTYYQRDASGLAVGIHNYTLIIGDSLGQVTTSTILVSVVNIVSIESDSDFSLQGWPGSGTALDPYVIENLQISYDGSMISISSVTSYFVVRNCSLSTFGGFGTGIALYNVQNGAIELCNFSADIGLNIVHSNNIEIYNNRFEDCTIGFALSDSSNIIITDNELIDCGFYIGFGTGCENLIFTNTNVNGKPIGYFEDLTGEVLDGSQYGQIILYNCTDTTVSDGTLESIILLECDGCTIINCDISNSYRGASILESIDCNIRDSTCYNCMYGIYLQDSVSCELINNTIIGSINAGIRSVYSPYLEIINNTFLNGGAEIRGIWLEHSDNVNITGNTIYDNLGEGIEILYSDYCTITKNDVSGNQILGLAIYYSNYTDISENIFSHNKAWGVRMEFCHHMMITWNTFDNNEWDGFCTYSCTDGMITDNYVFDNHCTGISIQEGKDFYLARNTVSNCSCYGIEFWRVNNATAENCVVYNESEGFSIVESTSVIIQSNVVYGHIWSGISAYSSSNLVIFANELSSNGLSGIHFDNVSDALLDQNHLFENTHESIGLVQSDNITITLNVMERNGHGIGVFESTNCLVTDNEIHDCTWEGIWLVDCESFTFENNTIYTTNYGSLRLDNSPYCTVFNNTFFAAGGDCILVRYSTYTIIEGNHLYHGGVQACGIRVFFSDYCEVTDNNIHHCYYAVAINGAHGTTVSGNTIHFNDFYAIWMDWETSQNLVTNNYIGWNGWETGYQAFDDGYFNNWNGNYWSYQQGPDDTIDGSAGSHDGYPSEWIDSVIPVIHGPDDITYNEGETGHLIIWENVDDYRWHYSIYKNDILILDGQLDYLNCWQEISVDGLTVGVYNYTLIVWDGYGNTAVDTVFVTVIDDTTPTLDSPVDIEYPQGTIGNTITWTMNDDHPSTYQIFLDGLLIDSGLWTYSGEIYVLSLDGLSVGLYNYTIQILDIGGNSASDTVFVTVFDDTVPTINHPADVVYEQGETGYLIEWSPSDEDPVSYQIFLDDVVIYSGPWTSSLQIFEVSVDGHIPGIYNYTIWVVDIGGNTVVDTVIITVNPDSTPPVITHPEDINYAEGTTGHAITWNPSDLLPVSYEILLDDVSIKSGPWNYSAEVIILNIDGLTLGTYNYTIIVTDIGGNFATDVVLVTVYDGTAPIIDSPTDIQYEEGLTGNQIVWTPFDLHPTTYEITRNTIPLVSDTWDETPISIDIDGLTPGVYVYVVIVYDIGGSSISDTVSVTVTDTVVPTIDSPVAVQYEEETLGNYITWAPDDAHPDSYIITRNGTSVKSGSWDGSSITINVDRLSPGVYNFTIVVYDESGNLVSDTVYVTVTEAITDEEPPEINHPDDIEYEEEETGFSISWTPVDANPDSYEILRNDTILDSGSWFGEGISISVDGLNANLYNYTLVVHDSFGNWASDLVWVNVTPKFVDSVPPTIDSPADIEYEEETTGHSITWTPLDDYPVSYEIRKDESIILSGSWNGDSISIGVDGLEPGLYNYTLTVYDLGVNSASDTVWVTVTEKFVDSVPPTIDSPVDIEYEEETTGHSITWTPLDDYPDYYKIEKNGTLLESGTWDGSQIVIGIDGLLPSLYNFTVTVFDIGGNWIADTVFVNVTEKFVDTIPPTIDSPTDVEYEEETTGHSITWTPLDDYPVSYEILRDGVLIETDVWDGSQISIDIDGLTPGIYIFRLIVYDVGENSASNSVVVTVTEKFVDTVVPTLDHPDDIEYEEESTGYFITWNAYDEYPLEYEIFSNGTLLDTDSWDSGQIVIGIDGLQPGLYNYTLIVTDIGFNTAVDTVWVTVTEKFVDLTPPVVDSPSDIYYEEGDSGYAILWHVSDGYPGTYEILRDHVIIRSGHWYGPTLSIGVDSLVAAVYNYTIVLYDESMNMVKDTVFVNVDSSLAPTITSPSDVEYVEESTGHSITWVPTDAYPDEYKIYRDGSLVKSSLWYGFAVSISIDGLLPGSYEYVVKVFDKAGNFVTDSVFVVVTFKITDWLPPTIDAPYDVVYEFGQTVPELVWHPDDIHPHSYKIFRNGVIIRSGDWDNEEIRIGVSGLSVGIYNYTAMVIDEFGNLAVDTVFVTVNDATVDTTAPYVNYLENYTYYEGETGNILTWTPSDANPSSYEITRDGILIRSGDWLGGSITIGIDRLPVEIYEYVLTVWDTHGHHSNSSTYVIVKQDGQNPADETQPAQENGDGPPVMDSPSDIHYEYLDTGSVIVWHPSDGEPSDYLIQRDGFILEAGLWYGGALSIDVDGLEPGSYVFSLTVYDIYSDAAYDEVIVTVNPTVLPLVSNPASISYELGDVGYVLSWNVFDAYPESYMIMRDGIVVDSGLWMNGQISIDVDGLLEGTHEFLLSVFDQAGNMATGSAYVSVESSMAPIIDSPDDITYDEDQSGFFIMWTPTDNFPFSYELWRDGTLLESESWFGLPVTVDVSGLEPGVYDYMLIVSDRVGNQASDVVQVVVNEVILDDLAPIITGPSDLSYEAGSIGHVLTWIATDENPAQYQITRNGVLIESGSWDGSSISLDINGLSSGVYSFVVTFTDVNLNTAADEVIVSVDPSTAPLIDSPVDIEYEQDMTGQMIIWHPTDDYPSSYLIVRNGVAVKSGTWSGFTIQMSVDGLAPGTYVFLITVKDTAGNTVSDEVTVTITPAVAPTINSPADLSFEAGETGWTLVWTAFDAYPTQYQITRNGLLVKSGTWDGSPINLGISTTLGAGLYEYIVTVTDSGGHSTTDTVLVEVAPSIAPTISSPADVDYEKGSTGNTILWNADDARPATYSIKRDGVVVKSGIWTTTSISIAIDGLQAGTYQYQITVVDKAGNSVSDTVAVIVNPSIAPLINSPSDINYEAGSIGHAISWTPFDAYPSTYTLLRGGVVIDSGLWTGESFTVDIDGLTPGTYIFKLRVADVINNIAEDEVTVTVLSQIAPIIDSPDDVIYQMGETGHSITWTPTDLYPDHYTIYRNETLVRSGIWNGDPVSIGVDGLSGGTYFYELTVYDESGLSASDIVQITVEYSPEPEMLVAVSSAYEYALPGEDVLYLISWMNLQQGIAYNAQLEITLDEYLLFVSSTSTLTFIDGVYTLDLGQIEGYGVGSLEIICSISMLAPNNTAQWLNASMIYYCSDLIEPVVTDDSQLLTVVSEAIVSDIHTASWWKNEFNFLLIGKPTTLSVEQLQQLVDMISTSSGYFADVDSCEKALDVLRMASEKGLSGLASRELYAVWLNLANDALTAGTTIDLIELTSSTTVGEAIVECETILQSVEPVQEDLVRVKNICLSINHGEF